MTQFNIILKPWDNWTSLFWLFHFSGDSFHISPTLQPCHSSRPSEGTDIPFRASSTILHITFLVVHVHLSSSADDEKSPIDEADRHEHEERNKSNAPLAGLRAEMQRGVRTVSGISELPKRTCKLHYDIPALGTCTRYVTVFHFSKLESLFYKPCYNVDRARNAR